MSWNCEELENVDNWYIKNIGPFSVEILTNICQYEKCCDKRIEKTMYCANHRGCLAAEERCVCTKCSLCNNWRQDKNGFCRDCHRNCHKKCWIIECNREKQCWSLLCNVCQKK